MRKRKSFLAALCLALALSAVFAGDILTVDGDKIHFNAEEGGYNYALKYLYDVSFPYGKEADNMEPSLREVVEFLSSGPLGPNVDSHVFINSHMGEKTAELWFPYMTWHEDPMDPGLVSYWEAKGIKKEAFKADGEVPADYFVYTPLGAMESGKSYPLIVLMHGGGERAYQTETFGYLQIAAREGIILAACEDTFEEATDALIGRVARDYPVDESRIYMTGSSQGGENTKRYAMAHPGRLAAIGIMDVPVGIMSAFYEATDEQLEAVKETGLPMAFLSGTADMSGMYQMHKRDYFLEYSHNASERYAEGWNELMDIFSVEGKDLTLERALEYSDSASNAAEYYGGYPFDTAVNVDTSGTAEVYECRIDGIDGLVAYIAVNRPHMPSGEDAELLWAFMRDYKRDPETGEAMRL